MTDLMTELTAALCSGQSGVLIRTSEPFDVADRIAQLAADRQWTLKVWNPLDGLLPKAGPALAAGPEPCLTAIRSMATLSKQLADAPDGREQTLVLLVHNALRELYPNGFASGVVDRMLLHAVQQCLLYGKAVGVHLVLLAAHDGELPAELAEQVLTLDHELPTEADLSAILNGCAPDALVAEERQAAGRWTILPDESAERKRMVKAARGLTASQAENAFSRVMFKQRKLDAQGVWDVKVAEINRRQLLRLDASEGNFSSLGGLDGLKRFCQQALDSTKERPSHVRARALLLLGIPGCLRGDVPIFDPMDGSTRTVRERYWAGQSFHVASMTAAGEVVVAVACPPCRYPAAPMIKVTLETGGSFTVTPNHRLRTRSGYSSVASLSVLRRESQQHEDVEVLLPTSSDSDLQDRLRGVRRWSQTTAGSPSGCLVDSRSCGERLPSPSDTGRDAPPSRAGVQQHIRFWSGEGDPSDAGKRSRPRCADHLAKPDSPPHSEKRKIRGPLRPLRQESSLLEPASIRAARRPVTASAHFGKVSRLPAVVGLSSEAAATTHPSPATAVGSNRSHFAFDPGSLRSGVASALQRKDRGPVATHFQIESEASANSRTAIRDTWNHLEETWIVQVEEAPAEEYFDFHVPGFNNYWACGVWHHNSGKSAFAKALGDELKRPTLFLDVGTLMGSLVGQTEDRTREALRVADAMEPCTLYVD